MWINVPSTISPFVLAEADLTLASNWLWELLARSAGWNGKPSPPSSWRRAWKRAAWLKRLCGRICEPSTASRGVASWIASLRATRVSHSASRVIAVDRMIRDTYGHMCIGLLKRFDPELCLPKTCQGISLSEPIKSSPTFKQWATTLRQMCSQRVKSVLLTSASDYSSLLSIWMTPNVPNGGRGLPKDTRLLGSTCYSGDRKVQLMLHQQASLWAYFHPLPMTLRDGDKLWPMTQPSRQLNLKFVNWLMGWPLIVLNGSGSLAMEWSHFKQRMRSCLCGLVSEHGLAA